MSPIHSTETLEVLKIERSLQRVDFSLFSNFSDQLFKHDKDFIQNSNGKLHLQNLSANEYGRHIIEAPDDSYINKYPDICQFMVKKAVEESEFFNKNLTVRSTGIKLEYGKGKVLVTLPILDSQVDLDTKKARETLQNLSDVKTIEHDSRFIFGWFIKRNDLASFLSSADQSLKSTIDIENIHLCKGKVTRGIQLNRESLHK